MNRNRPGVTRAAAWKTVRRYLDRLEADCRRAIELRKDLTGAEREMLGLPPTENCALVILDELTIEGDFGWVFFWQSNGYRETGDPLDGLVGNAPLLVSRRDGSLHETGTALPVEDYIENFRRCGNPQG